MEYSTRPSLTMVRDLDAMILPCALCVKLRGVQCLSPYLVITCITNWSHLSHDTGGKTNRLTYVSTDMMTCTLSPVTVQSRFILLMYVGVWYSFIRI